MSESSSTKRGRRTRLVHSGTPQRGVAGPVNTPVVRTSTVVFPDVATMQSVKKRRDKERLLSYGRRGTDTTFALEDAICELEGAARVRLVSSGLNAISLVFLACLRPGDHVVLPDSVYEPARKLCKTVLEPFGVRATYYAADGSDIEAKLRPETRLVYVECPGSLVYEMIDLPRVARIAHGRDILVAADNTWGSAWLYNPLELGADISVLAATKYIVGHSDVMMGAVATNKVAWPKIAAMADALGLSVSPDDAYLALRGLRTLAARLEMHQRHATALCEWFRQQPEVKTVFYPALASHSGHEIWRRDFSGACGLFSVEFKAVTNEQAVRFVDSLKLFALGSSWGGYESLVLPVDLGAARTVADWSKRGPIVRFHAGLEDPEDLVADLERAFGVFRLKKTGSEMT